MTAVAIFAGLVVVGLCLDRGLTNIANAVGEALTHGVNAYRRRTDALARGCDNGEEWQR